MKKRNIILSISIIGTILIVFIGILVYKNNEEKENINKLIVTDIQFWGNKEIANKAQEQFQNKKESQLKEKEELLRKNKNKFYGITYDLVNDPTYDYIGGQNDYTKEFNGVISDKSTEKDFLQYVNKAVGYLTMGAYENKIREQFVGKTWHGIKIKDCEITTYKLLQQLGKNDYDVLKKQGIDNLPNGKFAVVVGQYQKMGGDKYMYYVKIVVTFE